MSDDDEPEFVLVDSIEQVFAVTFDGTNGGVGSLLPPDERNG